MPTGAHTSRLDHGVIGNGRVLALVAPDSAIEWLCLPRFDSPSVFAALLDPEHGGVFRFRSGPGSELVSRGYVVNTNVLRSEFADRDARWEVIDFVPRTLGAAGQIEAPRELIRRVRPLAGIPTDRSRARTATRLRNEDHRRRGGEGEIMSRPRVCTIVRRSGHVVRSFPASREGRSSVGFVQVDLAVDPETAADRDRR